MMTTTTTTTIDARGLNVATPSGRPLFRDLQIRLAHEHVAVLGRNGVGKSTLLSILAGHERPTGGTVRRYAPCRLVPQTLDRTNTAAIVHDWAERSIDDPAFGRRCTLHKEQLGLDREPGGDLHLSRGEARKVHLLDARLQDVELLLLDEPTQDLDEAGLRWLLDWLGTRPQGVVAVSHDRRLLRVFDHFVTVGESGCRYLPGPLSRVEQTLEQEQAQRQQQYVKNLNTLANQERHNEIVVRRRRRKKNVGRLHELDRCQSRARLNTRKSYAQQSQARAAKVREDRIRGVRDWARATRRALAVTLPLEVHLPKLPTDDGTPIVRLCGASMQLDGRTLWSGVDLSVGRKRVAITGPNGAGKTTLLRTLLGQRTPTEGTAWADTDRIGSIAQGGTDWQSEQSLVARLAEQSSVPSLEAAGQLLLAHRFPLALAQRPLHSLSPGERVRAALICLFTRRPAIHMLVVDEPTNSLDLVGAAALRAVLNAWRGGLIVASHDLDFLDAIGIERRVTLDGTGGSTVR